METQNILPASRIYWGSVHLMFESHVPMISKSSIRENCPIILPFWRSNVFQIHSTLERQYTLLLNQRCTEFDGWPIINICPRASLGQGYSSDVQMNWATGPFHLEINQFLLGVHQAVVLWCCCALTIGVSRWRQLMCFVCRRSWVQSLASAANGSRVEAAGQDLWLWPLDSHCWP